MTSSGHSNYKGAEDGVRSRGREGKGVGWRELAKRRTFTQEVSLSLIVSPSKRIINTVFYLQTLKYLVDYCKHDNRGLLKHNLSLNLR